MRSTILFIVFALALGFTATSSPAQVETWTGQIVDRRGDPVPGVKALLQWHHPSDKYAVAQDSAFSDSAGWFRIESGSAPRKYFLHFQKPGYHPYSHAPYTETIDSVENVHHEGASYEMGWPKAPIVLIEDTLSDLSSIKNKLVWQVKVLKSDTLTPAENVKVELTCFEGGLYPRYNTGLEIGLTDAEGGFRLMSAIKPLSSCRYWTVLARATGNLGARKRLDLPEWVRPSNNALRDTTPHVLVLRPHPVYLGKAIDSSTGLPVASAKVELLCFEASGHAGTPTIYSREGEAQTDDGGDFRLTPADVLNSSCTLVFSKEGFSNAYSTVEGDGFDTSYRHDVSLKPKTSAIQPIPQSLGLSLEASAHSIAVFSPFPTCRLHLVSATGETLFRGTLRQGRNELALRARSRPHRLVIASWRANGVSGSFKILRMDASR